MPLDHRRAGVLPRLSAQHSMWARGGVLGVAAFFMSIFLYDLTCPSWHTREYRERRKGERGPGAVRGEARCMVYAYGTWWMVCMLLE